MTDATVVEGYEYDLRANVARHDAVPSEGERGLDVLEVVDWAKAGVPAELIPEPVELKPKQPHSEPFPKADVVVMTWTVAEWAALHQVFCENQNHMHVSDVGKKEWRKDWLKYERDYCSIHQYMVDVDRTHQGGAPSLFDQAWGAYRMVKIGGKNVLLVKSGMHLAQDGTELPLCRFVRKICEEAQPKLVLSIGTAGGVRENDALGCALITNSAKFHLLKNFKSAPFNGELYTSSWHPSDRYIRQAQTLAVQVKGVQVFPPSPQYEEQAGLTPMPPNSRIEIVDAPIITTDTFLFGTTKNGLDKIGCIVEMDDAVVAMVCKEQNTEYGFVRNVSDPVINGLLPKPLQDAWAGYIYEQRGLYTSYNGALAAWAVIAGN